MSCRLESCLSSFKKLSGVMGFLRIPGVASGGALPPLCPGALLPSLVWCLRHCPWSAPAARRAAESASGRRFFPVFASICVIRGSKLKALRSACRHLVCPAFHRSVRMGATLFPVGSTCRGDQSSLIFSLRHATWNGPWPFPMLWTCKPMNPFGWLLNLASSVRSEIISPLIHTLMFDPFATMR